MTCMAYSGGPSSFIAWRLLGQPPAVYLGVGNTARDREVQRVRSASDRFSPIDIQLTGYHMTETGTGWVPYMTLSMILACAQVSPDVVLAVTGDDYPVGTRRFFRRTERLLAVARGGPAEGAGGVPGVRIHTPAIRLGRIRLVRMYLAAFGREAASDLTEHTWSCHGPGPLFCGQCPGCWQRWTAFCACGIKEDAWYAREPERPPVVRWREWPWADALARQLRCAAPARKITLSPPGVDYPLV